MTGYRLTRLAQSDVDQIWLHIANDRPAAADRMLHRFEERFALLASNPEFGEMLVETHPDLRHTVVGNYVIVYRARLTIVEIVRVMHGARDWPAEL